MKKTEAARAKYLAQKKAYRDKNKDKIRAYNKVWKAKQKAKQAVQTEELSGKNEVLKSLRVAQTGAAKKLDKKAKEAENVVTLSPWGQKCKEAAAKINQAMNDMRNKHLSNLAPVDENAERAEKLEKKLSDLMDKRNEGAEEIERVMEELNSLTDKSQAELLKKFGEYAAMLPPPPTPEELNRTGTCPVHVLRLSEDDSKIIDDSFDLKWRQRDVKVYAEKLTWQLHNAMAAVHRSDSKECLLNTIWEIVCDLSATAAEARQNLGYPLPKTEKK